MEYMQGTLEHCIKHAKPSLWTRVGFCMDVAKGLYQFHSKGFVHKDIKPDNILLDGEGARLSDLGLSAPCAEQARLAHTLWAAPELLGKGAYTTKVDIFAYGLLVNFVFSGAEHARDSQGRVTLRDSPYFSELVQLCISEQAARPTASEICHFFNNFKDTYEQLQRQSVAELEYQDEDDGKDDHNFALLYPAVMKTLA
jgi:serine/threonine protein kinase